MPVRTTARPAPDRGQPAAWEITLSDHVSALTASPDGRQAIAASFGGEALLLDTTDGAVTAKLDEHSSGASCAGWSIDSSMVAAGGHDGIVAMSSRSGDPLGQVRGGGWVTALAWSPRGPHRVAVAIGRRMIVAEPDGGQVAVYDDHESTVTSLAWSPDGTRVAAGCYGGVTIYEPSGDRRPRKLAWKGSILTVAYSPDGRWLVHGNQDASVHLWRLSGDDELEMAGYPAKIETLAFDPTGRWLAVGSVGNTTLWDMRGKGPSGRKPTVLDGHTRRVSALAWHAESILASGSADGTVALWDPAKSKRPAARLDVDDEVAAISWIPGTRALLTGTASGRVARHDLPATPGTS